MFCNTNRHIEIRIDCFDNSICRKRCRYINNGYVCTCYIDSFLYSIEYRNTFDFKTAFTRCYPSNDLRSVFKHLFCMEKGCFPSNPLYDYFCLFINEHTHAITPPSASTNFTIFCAPSAIESAATMFKPDSFNNFLPSSTFVPSKRTTNGTAKPTSFAAVITPFAMMSHFMIPPKMLTKIPLTFLSDKMILNASVTFSAVAPPPT